jgi:predicted RNase H-like nuclease (RuvC/YqgF family)
MKKSRIPKVLLVLFLGGILVVGYLVIYGIFSGSISPERYESLKNTYKAEIEKLTKLNRELKNQLSQIREKLEKMTEERNSLQNDKSQLLYMLEKLEQRVNQSPFASDGEKMIRKFALSWLRRISELRDQYVLGGASARDAFIGEVNQIIEGLKEDFSGDSFLSQVRDCTVSSNITKDIKTAQKKLDAISKHLREYYLPSDD